MEKSTKPSVPLVREEDAHQGRVFYYPDFVKGADT